MIVHRWALETTLSFDLICSPVFWTKISNRNTRQCYAWNLWLNHVFVIHSRTNLFWPTKTSLRSDSNYHIDARMCFYKQTNKKRTTFLFFIKDWCELYRLVAHSRDIPAVHTQSNDDNIRIRNIGTDNGWTAKQTVERLAFQLAQNTQIFRLWFMFFPGIPTDSGERQAGNKRWGQIVCCCTTFVGVRCACLVLSRFANGFESCRECKHARGWLDFESHAANFSCTRTFEKTWRCHNGHQRPHCSWLATVIDFSR